MAPQTQKALVVTAIGKPLTVTTIPIPQPTNTQIQVRVTVAGPNPHDQKARDAGLFIADRLPAILTNDVVGKVTAVGSEVTGFAVGDRVVGQAGFGQPPNSQNGFQEYALLDEGAVAKIPDEISDDEAATLPTNIIAPLVALFDKDNGFGLPEPWSSASSDIDLKATTVLVIGGGSNCGRFGVQLAKLAGVGRIVVVGGDEQELKSYGATHILDRHGSEEEVLARIRAVVGDDLLYAYDAVNAADGQVLGINALSTTKRGKFARLLPSGIPDETKVHPKQEGYDLLNVFGLSHAKPHLAKPFWEHVPQYLTEGKLKATSYTVVKGLDVDKVNEVLDKYRDGKKVVKTHFHVSE